MFGENEIVGKKYFKEAGEERMFVTSMFMTLQGEGPYRGEPAFFIRLAKCNLNCSFCDTFFDDGDWLTFDEIEARVETTIDEFYKDIGMDRPKWTEHNTGFVTLRGREVVAKMPELIRAGADVSLLEKTVDMYAVRSDLPEMVTFKVNSTKKQMVLVMTGGEPMLQDNIGPFLERMQGVFANTQIESNGTQNTAIPESTTLVISPKCLEKNGVAVRYLVPRPEVLERASCLKFVMEANPESPYAVVPDWALEWKRTFNRPVFVSPMNNYNDIPALSKKKRLNSNSISLEERSTVDEVISFWEPGLLNMEENQKNHEYVARYCVTHGLILNLQIHLYASLA